MTRAAAATGVLAEHIPRLMAFAQQHQVLIGIRKVEPSAARLIAQGYQTKNLHIKGKSSNWGPMSGFIPVDQNLSKLAGKRDDVIRESNRSVINCVDTREGIVDPTKRAHVKTDDEARSMIVAKPLRLSLGELQTLDQQGIIELDDCPSDATLMTMQARPPQTGESHAFEANQAGDGLWTISYKGPVGTLHGPAKVVEILGYDMLDARAETQPGRAGMAAPSPSDTYVFGAVTADYDLLVLAPSIGDYGSEDRSALVFSSQREATRINPSIEELLSRSSDNPIQKQIRKTLKGKRAPSIALPNYLSGCDPHGGNTSQRLASLIGPLNDALAGGPGSGKGRGAHRPLVHHGDDIHNPFSEANANFPALLITPDVTPHGKQAEASFMVINNQQEFETVYRERLTNFVMFWNEAWGDRRQVQPDDGTVKEMLRDSFIVNRARVESQLSGSLPPLLPAHR